jgi:phage shock protein C
MEAVMSKSQRRLYRSKNNKVLAGICGGIGEYLNIDPTIIRIMMIVMTIFGGSGILLYAISFFVIPDSSAPQATSQTARPSSLAFGFGIALIAVGALILLDNLDLISFHRWWNVGWDVLVPTALIVAGLFILTKKKDLPKETSAEQSAGDAPQAETSATPTLGGQTNDAPGSRTLRRSKTERKLLGVCGGLAEFSGLDPTIVRLMYVAFTLLSAGAGFVLYAVLFFIVPEEQEAQKG